MAAIVITSGVNTFTVVSNDYAGAIGTPKISINKSEVQKVYMSKDSTFVVIEFYNTKEFRIDLLGYLGGSTNRAVKIDSFNGVAPATIEEIHDLFNSVIN